MILRRETHACKLNAGGSSHIKTIQSLLTFMHLGRFTHGKDITGISQFIRQGCPQLYGNGSNKESSGIMVHRGSVIQTPAGRHQLLINAIIYS